ncbi:MAG: sulfite reductase subunit gamma [Hyphomicrobiales bacterium]|nr:MAG: sulfite reductase subunit gamma [Hyphomicrobiales bacterium]
MRAVPETISTTRIGTRDIRRDGHGYLVDPADWNEEVAEVFAAEENLTLTDEHWAVLLFMRAYLDEHGIAADARFTFRFLAARHDESERAARQRFFTLFPYGYVKQACKISGMRQPRAWSTG